MFKMMEQGQLLAKDVLPQVSKEMGRMANVGGALEQKLMTTRVQQGRFNNELERSGNVIFKSGFDEGLASLFNTLTEELSDGRKGLEGFGQMFKFVFETIGMTAKIVSPIIDSFMFVFGGLFSVINKINDVIGNNFITTLLALGGGFLALRKGISKLPLLGMFFKDAGDKADDAGKGVKKFGVIAGLTLRGMFFWATLIVSALDEVFSLFTKDRVGLLEKYIFGKDTGFESWDDLVSYMSNTDMSQIGSNLGGAVFDGVVKALEMAAGYISKLGGVFATALFEMDWGALANKFILLLGQGILNVLMLIPSFFAGFLNNMIEKVTGVDLGLGDSLSDSRESMNKYLNGVIEKQGDVFITPERRMLETESERLKAPSMMDYPNDADGFDKAMAEYERRKAQSSKLNNSLTSSPASSLTKTSINSPTNNTRSNTSNNVTNSVTVNYNAANENNFGSQGAIADDIATKVQEALNQNFQAAELSNGG